MNNKIIYLLNKEIKEARADLLQCKKDRSTFCFYDDCADFYYEQVTRAEGRLSALIVVRGKIKKSLADPSESVTMDAEQGKTE
jgi:hypothetical protein